MVFRRLHLGTVAYGMDSMDEVQSHVFSAYTQVKTLLLQNLLSVAQREEMNIQKTNRKEKNEIPPAWARLKQTDVNIV